MINVRARSTVRVVRLVNVREVAVRADVLRRVARAAVVAIARGLQRRLGAAAADDLPRMTISS